MKRAWEPEAAELTHLPLMHLSPEVTKTLVANLTGGRPLPAEALDQILVKTDGVPMFVEELTRMVQTPLSGVNQSTISRAESAAST